MKILRILLCLAVLFSQLGAKAQDFSNKGKEFWIAYPAHVDGNASVMGLYITASVNTTGTIELAGGTPIPFTVQANVVTRVFLNAAGTGTATGTGPVYFASNANVYLSQTNAIKTNSAIRITSQDPVVVYSHIIRAARSAATLALPTQVLGNEYIATSMASTQTQPVTGNGTLGGVSEIAVVATLPNTVVTILPTAIGRNGEPVGQAVTVTLANAGDCYQFQSGDRGDLSGTKITSTAGPNSSGCKPVAVFSASTWSAFDCTGATGGDNLYQQLFPIKSWGRTFVTAPFINRPEDIFRIYCTSASTAVTVQVDGVTTTLGTANYNAAGKYYTYRSGKPLVITGSDPISVAQYITSQTCKTGCSTGSGTPATCYSDPEMVILSPVEQTLQDITFFSAHKDYVPAGQTQVQLHFVNLIISKNFKGTLKIDNAAPKGSFVDIAGSNYSYLQEDLTSSSASNPIHRVTADSNFAAIVYGYGEVESYGYNGGTNVKDFSNVAVFQNPFQRIDSAVTCVNSPLRFSIPLTFQPQTILWDFSAAPNITPNTNLNQQSNIVADSTRASNGQTINYYSTKTTYTFVRPNTTALRDTIKLFTTSATPDGCGSTSQVFAVPVKVYDQPVGKFNLSASNCVADSIHLTDQSTIGVGVLSRWLWTFGDNTTDDRNSGAVFAKKYAAAGSYTIKMKAISSIGCASDEISQAIVLTDKPTAKFTLPSIACTDTDIIFTDASTSSAGTIVKWIWDLDNGAGAFTNTTNAAVKGQYPVYGLKNPSLQVELGNGCRSDAFVPSPQLRINPAPQVGFIAPAICLNDANAQFTDTSKIAEGSTSFTYLWKFNAGTPAVSPGPSISTSTLKNPLVRYNKPDNYTVSLTATSALGCGATKEQMFTVNGSTPKADFEILGSPPFCGTNPVVIRNNSTVDFGGLTKVELYWDLVNAPAAMDVDAAAPVASPKTYQHSYPDKQLPSSQQYTVKLYAYSGGSTCVDATTRTVTVFPQPQAAFTVSDTSICDGNLITFSDKSNGVSSSIVSWSWDLGKGDLSAMQNPQKQYVDSGLITVSLVTRNADGCASDTLKKQLTVYPNPQLLLKHEVRVLEGGTLIIVPEFVYGNDLQYLWTPSTYLSSDTAINPVSKPDDEITYKLHLTGTGGCTVTDTIHVIVLKGPVVPNVFSPNGDGINDVWKIKYLEYYPDAIVQVFNRYGQVVYASVGYNNGWDGTYKGSALPIGTYYYIINPRNGRPTVSGSVTIIK